MQVKTYRARSLREALQRVREELGANTRILQTREVRTGWWDRVARGRQFEIRMRTTDEMRPASSSQRSSPFVVPMPPAAAVSRVSTTVPTLAETTNDALEFRDRVRSGLHDQRSYEAAELTDVTRGGFSQQPTAVFELLADLVEAEVPEATAREIVREASDEATQDGDLQQLKDIVIQMLDRTVFTTGPIAAQDQQQVIALVGPTGVGKTTTIAKLAADLRLRQQCRVALITVDTYRVAAVDQLRTYADIMDLPMEVVTTPREMRDAVTRLSDEDVILVDTAGRSPHDAVQLQQLKAMLGEARPTQTQLVLSCVSSESHLRQNIQKFAPLGCTSLLITKLDEATGLGHLVSLFRQAKLPVSFLTCGQSVPDDIVVADKQKLLAVLVGRQPIASLV